MPNTPVRRGRGIATRLSLPSITLIALASSGVAWFVIAGQSEDRSRVLVVRGEALATMVALNAEYGIYTEDASALALVVKSAFTDEAVESVAVFNAQGRRLAERRRDGTATRGSRRLPADFARPGRRASAVERHDMATDEPMVDVVAPVYSGAGALELFDGAGRGEPRQVPVPRQHQPRDPDADERRARHDRAAAGDPARRRAARVRRRGAELGRGPLVHHQRHSRSLEDRGRAAGARVDRGRPARRGRGDGADPGVLGAEQGPRARPT